MRLSDDELRDVLARAEEIQYASGGGGAMHSELEAVIGAAEEIGLTRTAVERALRERLNLPMSPPAIGTRVFARSADDRYYVAEVLSHSAEGTRVRFLRGSEHVVAPDELRQCSFLPGERIVADWPWWGPWNCAVVSYDAVTQRVELSDRWGDTETFPISEVWLAPRKAGVPSRSRARVYATLIGTGIAVGGVLGSIITALLLR